jgi:hypothetical protein
MEQSKKRLKYFTLHIRAQDLEKALFDDLQNIIVTRFSTMKTKELWQIKLEFHRIKISSLLWSDSEAKERKFINMYCSAQFNHSPNF